MSETVRLFSQSPKTAGQSMTLPVVGTVTFDKELNYIDVLEAKVEELQSRQFGITLLTAEVVKENKEESERGKHKTKIKGVLTQESISSLSDSFNNLKDGRSQEEQDYLDLLMEDLKTIGIAKKSAELSEAEKMLRALSQQELRELLSAYPTKETRPLNSMAKVLTYLLKKMS